MTCGTGGSSKPQGSLLALLRRLPDASGILGARERLLVPTQVEAAGGVLVPGEIVGTGTGPGPGVDTVAVYAGHGLPPAGSGPAVAGGLPAVVLDRGFAQQNRLPATGSLLIAGGARVRYTGTGQSPEYFVASGGAGGTPYLSQKIYAVLFTTLATAQRLAPAPGQVNRGFAYLPASAAPAFGMTGYVNALSVTPAAGYSAVDLQRALLDVPHVASAQGVQATLDGLRSALGQLSDVLDVASVLALLLVLLIAFNTASIGADERSREHATMIAFGLPVRTILGMTMTESLLAGIVGSAAAVAVGYGVLSWVVAATMPSVAPDIGIITSLSVRTILGAVLLGSGVVAAAPLLTLRRLLRLEVPSALRILE